MGAFQITYVSMISQNYTHKGSNWQVVAVKPKQINHWLIYPLWKLYEDPLNSNFQQLLTLKPLQQTHFPIPKLPPTRWQESSTAP